MVQAAGHRIGVVLRRAKRHSQAHHHWPEQYLPGTTDIFASNEVIVKGLKVEDVWPYLTHATVWEKYYANSSDAKYMILPWDLTFVEFTLRCQRQRSSWRTW